MNNYLVVRQANFFDPHGSNDRGGVEKYIVHNDAFTEIDPNKFYNDRFEPSEFDNISLDDLTEYLKECEHDDLQAQDGYNCKVYSYRVEEIKEEEVITIQTIINQYKNL